MRNIRTIVAAGVVTLVLVLLVGAAVLAGRQGPTNYPDGSPEATVQAYFQALIDGDPIEMHAQFTDEFRDRCRPPTTSDIAYLEVSRVTVDEVDTTGDDATVRVSITQDWGGGPFAADESTFDETFRLVDTDAGWRIDDQAWPYVVCRHEN